MFNKIIILLSLLIISSCSNNVNKKKNIDSSSLLSINYMQTSAEVRALYYQAFNIAKFKLDNYLKLKVKDDNLDKENKKDAIIVDVDETIVVTIPYNAINMMKSRNYPNGWKEWIDKLEAKPVAGAIEFLQYAKSKNITIFYVTNRKENVKESTYKNLKNLGYPILKENLLTKNNSSNKSLRRKKVLEYYEVILYIGDNLIDFPGNFDKEFTKTINGRKKQVEKYKKNFGDKWIILPNSVYGDWENVIYNYNWDKTVEERIKEKEKVLEY